MAGISSKAAGKLENKYKFNGGTELNSSFDLSLYETDFRLYDPQIGRFVQPDELAEEFDNWSPYAFANDNPILLNDPTGLASDTAVLPTVTVTSKQNKSPGYSMVNNPGVSLKKTFDPNTLGVQYNPYRAWDHKTINQHTTGWEMIKTGGEIVTWVFPWGRAIKGVRWVYRANKMRQVEKAATSVSKYLKLFKPQNEFDLVKTLYRGTTGSEAGSSILFLTDDAAVAATYIKNGGEVASYELTNFSLKSLQAAGELSLKTGMHGTTGAISTEYMFQGKNLVEALNTIAK